MVELFVFFYFFLGLVIFKENYGLCGDFSQSF